MSLYAQVHIIYSDSSVNPFLDYTINLDFCLCDTRDMAMTTLPAAIKSDLGALEVLSWPILSFIEPYTKGWNRESEIVSSLASSTD